MKKRPTIGSKQDKNLTMKRRQFIQNAAMASAGMALYACNAPAAPGKPIGLQLYTLKDIIKGDVKGTMRKVSDIGYKELEAYSYSDGKIFDLPYGDFNAMAKDLGMRIVSGHYGTGQIDPDTKGTLSNGWEVAVEDAKAAGQDYMVIAWLHPEERKSIDDYKRVCGLINKGNEVCRTKGITLAYHNHEFEFSPLDGEVPYEVMLQELDASVLLELDLYWSTFSGVSATELFKKYPGRFPLWHVKDMDKTDRTHNTDVGTGSIDFPAIFGAAEAAGMKHFFLEQEWFAGPQIESITNGYKYLSGIVG